MDYKRPPSAIGVTALAGLALCGLKVPAARAQSISTVRLEFEVASIKPHAPSASSPRVSTINEHGRITYTGITVRGLIRDAYGLRMYPPAAASDPLATDRYDIFAKASGEASKEQTMRMLQSLLAERFKLALHRETKQLPVYALVVGKNGPKFREVPDDGSAPEIGGREGSQIKAHHISMKLLAGVLSGYTGDAVLDATGLTGLFDLTLDFSVDESMSADRTPGPTIFEAVQWQLGLKLEARKGPVEVIVIDHVEKPSEN
jgi:uncharacterized protein (TIGR03435 family)